MTKNTMKLERVYGVRLSQSDSEKLCNLAAHLQRPVSEVLRVLVRLVEPTNLSPLRLGGQAGEGVQMLLSQSAPATSTPQARRRQRRSA